MFDIGWTELLVIGALALIVVGPKDLPRLLRTLGQYTAQARGMARDFQRSMEQAAREADITDMKEMRDTADSLNKLRRMSVDDMLGAPKSSPTAKPAAVSPASQKPAAPMRVEDETPAPAPAPVEAAAPSPQPTAPREG
ncbi:MAG: Sec-independent protein translocase protein TatB [Rubrimonas sp.]|uniref:Sec-independent protein translocase protein TatB n=1 Tax=Rubrimonas sp. TaxID=2036015 RepID=UPI002FDDBBD3